MKTAIIKGLNEKDAEDVRAEFVHSPHFRRQLQKLLTQKIESHNSTVRHKDAYGIANWSYLQADAVGYERALMEVISLLDHTAEEVEPLGADLRTAVPKRRGRPPKVPPSA